jgi:hypothetical protein
MTQNLFQMRHTVTSVTNLHDNRKLLEQAGKYLLSEKTLLGRYLVNVNWIQGFWRKICRIGNVKFLANKEPGFYIRRKS